MNAEYKRQTVIKLVWLSGWMMSELDSRSEHYWDQHLTFVHGRVEAITSHLKQRRMAIEMLNTELWIDPWLYRQHNMANLIDIDPFLPKRIRRAVARFYQERVVDMSMIYTKVMSQFFQEVIKNTMHQIDPDTKIKCWTTLNDAYSAKGWGWEETHRRLFLFQHDIERYLITLR